MAYYKHPDLHLPDKDCLIWRYMEFSKFLAMLSENAIFFSRADRQSDNFEGEYPKNMLIELERIWGEGLKSDDGNTYTFLEWHTKKEITSRLISCWSAGQFEMHRRWAAYTTNTEAISIRSNIERFTNCFSDYKEPIVWIGKIRYGEEENRLSGTIFRWNKDYFLYPFFAKKEIFRWEDEIKAIVNISQKKQAQLSHSSNGCFVKVNLHQLIESVWIHPNAPRNFKNQVEKTLVNYGLGKIKVYQISEQAMP